MMGRLGSALVAGDPTSAETPGRRALTGLMSGVLIMVLIVGGFAVYGWIVPGGSKSFTAAGVILVEKESGTRYVYRDGRLHPTPNLTSAMLIQGTGAHVQLISRGSLRDVPRGPAIGIAGAPQSIPTDALVSGPWLVCLPGSRSDNPGNRLGLNLDPRATWSPLATDRFTVVRDPDGVPHLLAHGTRFRVTDEAVLVALGVSTVRQVRAPRSWLEFLHSGPDLSPATIPSAGSPGPQLGGRSYPVGTLVRQRQPQAGIEQLFVLRTDGLAVLSRTEFLLARATTEAAPVELDAATLAAAPKSSDRSLTNRLPDLAGLTWQDPGSLVLCLSQGPVSTTEVASIISFAPLEESGVDDAGQVSVHLGPGTGMAVLPIPAKQLATPQPWFISEEGVAFGIEDAQSVAALKLDAAAPVPFPKSLLAMLRQGPMLSRGAATALVKG